MTNTLMEHAAQAAFPDNAHGALVAAFREAFAMGWQAALQSLEVNELARVLDGHAHCRMEYRYADDGSVTERILSCGLPLPQVAGGAPFRATHQVEALLTHLIAQPEAKEGARWRG